MGHTVFQFVSINGVFCITPNMTYKITYSMLDADNAGMFNSPKVMPWLGLGMFVYYCSQSLFCHCHA